ncbi:MAG: cyclic nucleotide-binding domain-containing protein [Treponema sp.]|jgi:CRP-like cAMP-binding protein|nr:cyclic nucleotide-binding domain-containing protein [Treponema sp.]
MVEPSALQKYSLFGGLMEDQIVRLLPLMEQERYQPGDIIMTEGELNDRIHFILSGRVDVYKGDVNLTEFKEGDFFGEMEVLDVMPTAATIKALCPVELMSISNRSLREIYKTDAKIFSMIIMNLARDLSRRLRRMDDRVLDHS